MPADRANDQEVFLTLEDVMKEKCLDHVATLVGLDEKTIEEDFKAVDTDEDGAEEFSFRSPYWLLKLTALDVALTDVPKQNV